MFESGDNLAEAWDKAKSAYFLSPEQVEIVRTAARIYGSADMARALPLWEEAVHLTGGDPEDRKMLIEAAFATRNLFVVKGGVRKR